MMKIAFFIDSLNCGGAERSLVSLLQKLNYSRLEVHLYAWNIKGVFAALIPDKVKMHTLPVAKTGLGRLWHRVGQLQYSALIRLVPRLGMKRHKAELLWRSIHTALPKIDDEFDVAISYQQGFMTYYVADKVKSNRKIAWINSQLSGHNHRVKFSRHYYDKFDDIVCVSDVLYNILSKSQYVDAARLTTIYDMLNVDVIRSMANEPTDCQLKDADSQYLLVTVARLTPPKNLPLAIDAAKLLHDRGVNFKWVIVGGGVIWNELQNKITSLGLEGIVVLTGQKVNPYPYIKAADIYVQTSSYEGFGLTIAEAKILHKPVVSTNFSVVYDQITDGVNGLIAEMTPDDVADKIQQLIDDAALRNRIINAVSIEENTTAQTEVAKFYRLLGKAGDKPSIPQ